MGNYVEPEVYGVIAGLLGIFLSTVLLRLRFKAARILAFTTAGISFLIYAVITRSILAHGVGWPVYHLGLPGPEIEYVPLADVVFIIAWYTLTILLVLVMAPLIKRRDA